MNRASIALILSLTAPAVHAQVLRNDPFAELPPLAPTIGSSRVLLAFRLLAEIPLPGPLPGEGPRWSGEMVEIAVAGGTAVTALTDGAAPRIDADRELPTPNPAEVWAVDSRGKLRFRAPGNGFIEAQKRCKRCETGWKRKWRLRVAGAPAARPLVVGKHVYFGAMDNNVYCVKAGSGHRVWVTDVGGRVPGPLVLWSAIGAISEPGSITVDALLAVLEAGSELVVLGAPDGSRIGGLTVDSLEGKLVDVPLTTPDGRVIVARQKYAAGDAALLIYRLAPPAAPPPDPSHGEPALPDDPRPDSVSEG